MSSSDAINNIYLKQSREHKIIINYVYEFDKKLKDESEGSLLEYIEQKIPWLKKELIEHFHLEEKIFFPAILSEHHDVPCIKDILNLQKEHGSVEREVDHFIEHYNHRTAADSKHTSTIITLYKGIICTLRDHARFEVHHIFPLIDRMPKLRYKVDKFIEAYCKKA